MFTVVSWYTPDYASSNARLVASLEKHGYMNHIEYPVEPVGKWGANVLLKPHIIRRAFAELGTDLVYLDSDAVVHGKLDLFDNWQGEDLGAHWREERELLGGTLYLSNTSRSRAFCESVADGMAASQAQGLSAFASCWQVTAQRLLPKYPEVTVRRLPPEYTFIFDTFRLMYPDMQPVIEHMQQSRQVEH
jgi:hypothetical protein